MPYKTISFLRNIVSYPVIFSLFIFSACTNKENNTNQQEAICGLEISGAAAFRLYGDSFREMPVNRPFNCGLLSTLFLEPFGKNGSARPVGAGRGCADGASAARGFIASS